MKRGSEEPKIIIYTGPSMNPTLQNLDKLFYAPYKNSKIKRGDIVVFLDREKNIKVIHRVKIADSKGIVTMGDNNPKADSHIHRSDEILGRVIYGIRGNRKIRIYNALPGTMQAEYIRLMKKINNVLCNILKPPYYLFSGKFRLPMRKKVMVLQRSNGKELYLAIGKVVIARQRPGEKWQIRPPFKLFLDESSLQNYDEKSINYL
jgi:hypothetical protein